MNRPLKHKGRWKTRGGRDQDRWRGDKGDKERSRRKCREVCRQIDFEWNCRVQVCGDCFGDSMSGALQLGNNPDCDSVKWIKAGVYDVSDYSADAAAEKMKGGE